LIIRCNNESLPVPVELALCSSAVLVRVTSGNETLGLLNHARPMEAVAKDILPDDSQVKVSLSLNFQEAQRPYSTTRSWAIRTIEEMVYKHEKAEETERKAKVSRGEGR